MKIYIVTENYLDGSKYVCSATHRGTGEHVQVHRTLCEAEDALRQYTTGSDARDTFTYEINELEI
jgi:hypothetical protein